MNISRTWTLQLFALVFICGCRSNESPPSPEVSPVSLAPSPAVVPTEVIAPTGVPSSLTQAPVPVPTTTQPTSLPTTPIAASSPSPTVVPVSLGIAPALIYPVSTFVRYVNTPGAPIVPLKNEGGAILNCVIVPSLPQGLSISPDCVISGTPVSFLGTNGQASITTAYAITASNAAGLSTVGLSIQVFNTSPVISYSQTSFTATVNTPFLAKAINSGGSIQSCSATGLPPGLSISSSCEISGTPTVVGPASNVQVKAANATTPDAFVTIYISINSAASQILYPVSAVAGLVNTPINALVPFSSGYTLSGCTSSPPLPAGIRFDASCGISGTPSAASSPTNYQISATNALGQASGSLNIIVLNAITATQTAYFKAPNSRAGSAFGLAVAVSADGSTLAVGSPGDASNQNTITNGSAASTNTSMSSSGAVYIFTKVAGNWVGQAYLKAPNNRPGMIYGTSVALSSDGNTLAVGAPGEQSNATTITNGPTASTNNSILDAGAVYVVTRSGSTWSQQAYLKAPNSEIYDYTEAGPLGYYYGASVALSADGNTLAVGAPNESINQAGIINGRSAPTVNAFRSNVAWASGAVYINFRSGTTWSQQAYMKATQVVKNPVPNSASPRFHESFGTSVALAADGNTVAVGSPNGAETVYIAVRNGALWQSQASITAPNRTTIKTDYGATVQLSADGNTLAIGAPSERSGQTTITNGPTAPFDNSYFSGGAVYVSTRVGTTWSPQAYLKPPNNTLIYVWNPIAQAHERQGSVSNYGAALSLSLI